MLRPLRLLLRAAVGRTPLAAALWCLRVRVRHAFAPPASLRQKIRHRMAVDRRPVLHVLADKWAAREYVAERVGPRVLTTVYALVEDADDVPWDDLPPRFVIKATHASGATLVVDDRADTRVRVPTRNRLMPWGPPIRVNPTMLDRAAAERLLRHWLAADYWRAHGVTEWAYRGIAPRLIVEELLDDGAGEVPPDIKFWCFGGIPGFVQVDIDRLGRRSRALVRPDWRPLDARISNAWTGHPPRSEPPPRPERLEELTEVASLLASGLDFVRVDLYDTPERAVFGELTLYPCGGTESASGPDDLDAIGAAWRPERT